MATKFLWELFSKEECCQIHDSEIGRVSKQFTTKEPQFTKDRCEDVDKSIYSPDTSSASRRRTLVWNLRRAVPKTIFTAGRSDAIVAKLNVEVNNEKPLASEKVPSRTPTA